VQAWSTPQIVPSGAGSPVSLHTGPALHDWMPVWHTSAGVQAALSTQPTQTPDEQTWSAPQLVPSGALPLGTHAGAGSHAMVPVRHASAGWHVPPAQHERKSQVAVTVPWARQSVVKPPWMKSTPFTCVPT
jgi:hypothetical protein